MGIDMGAHTNNGLNVTFKNLRYRVNAPKNENASNDGFLTILNETEGRAENGEMVALMGASGAGKVREGGENNG
jgi:ABC-type multidrug transport system ATPase subunit